MHAINSKGDGNKKQVGTRTGDADNRQTFCVHVSTTIAIASIVLILFCFLSDR